MASVINDKCQVTSRCAQSGLSPSLSLSKCPCSLCPAFSGRWRGVLWTDQGRPVVTAMFSLHSAGMIGYGMAKGAVHQLCQSLAGKDSGMPSGAAAIAVLP